MLLPSSCLCILSLCGLTLASKPDVWSLFNDRLSTADDLSCQISHAGRYDMTRGRSAVSVVTTADSSGPEWEQPSLPSMNGTAGEQWEFDGVSDDGTQAFIFGVYRDPNYSFLGTGNLRAYVEIVFADESRYAVVDYAEEATVTTCAGYGTRGVWEGPGFVYTFEVTDDMSNARWTVASAELNATVQLLSVSRPKTPRNHIWPLADTTESLEVVPHFYWTEPIPTAKVEARIVVGGQTHSWVGIGGHERLWGAFNWRTCLSGLKIIRLQAGPLSLTLWEFTSGRNPNITFSSLAMFEDGQKILGIANTTQLLPDGGVGRVSEGSNEFVLRKLYNPEGFTTEHLKDKATGIELQIKSPKQNREWQFTVTFQQLGFEYVLTEGRGGTGYAGTVLGGLIDAHGRHHQVHGPAFVEIMKFPEGDWWLLPDNYVE